MSLEHWVFLVFAIATMAAVGYFATREDRHEKHKKTETNKEPSFKRQAKQDDDEATKTADNAAHDNVTAKTADNVTTTAENKAVANTAKIKTPAKPQGMLPVENFTPPSLPSVPEEIFPVAMCYAIALYGKEKMAMLALGALQKALANIKKQDNYVLGFDTDTNQWRFSPDMECQDWLVAVPLADRGGAMDDKYIRQIEEQTRIFAQKLAMHVIFPKPHKALEDAAHIDRFCATVDMFIELRLTGDKQPNVRVEEVMKLIGMNSSGDRDYICRINSETWFSGKLMPTLAGGERQIFILEMDAPNVSDPPRAFDEMFRAATRAAQMLGMKITDPQGAEIDEVRAAGMRKQLSLLASQMREFGAAPGGSVARLIFS
ncbi:MAG: hypothetical protein ACNYPH_04215 [Gammaproteobacteria bacterium WSBS_2016_MAG_OTU1]